MADFTALKTAIQNAIKQNGNEEITGNLLQDVLLAIVTTLGEGNINNLINSLDAEVTARQQAVSAEAQARQLADSTLQGGINTVSAAITAINNAIGNGCVYAGIATPSSTPASGRVFYLALTAGTYTNYGGFEVSQGINILKNNGSTWSLDSFLGIDDAPTPTSNNLIKSGGAFDFVMKNGSAFDLSAYNNGTTYADLNAALTALNALPAAYKKGGMSVKYVQSSDNKYVQARLMANSFSTDVSQWQIVVEELLLNSKDIITSGAARKVSDLCIMKWEFGGIDSSGNPYYNEDSNYNKRIRTGFVAVCSGEKILQGVGEQTMAVIGYDENYNYISNSGWVNSYIVNHNGYIIIVLRKDTNNSDILLSEVETIGAKVYGVSVVTEILKEETNVLLDSFSQSLNQKTISGSELKYVITNISFYPGDSARLSIAKKFAVNGLKGIKCNLVSDSYNFGVHFYNAAGDVVLDTGWMPNGCEVSAVPFAAYFMLVLRKTDNSQLDPNDGENILSSIVLNYDYLKVFNHNAYNILNHTINANGEWYSEGKHILIPRNELGDTIKIDYVSGRSGQAAIAFLKSESTVVGNAAAFCDGYTSRILVAPNTSYLSTLPLDCKYLYIATLGGDNQTDVNPDFIYTGRECSKDNAWYDISYQGKKVEIGNIAQAKKSVNNELVGTQTGQGSAVYGDYLFMLYDTGIVKVFNIADIDNIVYVGTFNLGSAGSSNHSNSAQFGNVLSDNGFPYLYVAKYSTPDCYVEKINTTDSELVQTIHIDITNILPNDILGSCHIGDDGHIYYVGWSVDRLYFCKFRKVAVTEGVSVTIGESDLLDSWQDSDWNFYVEGIQGFDVHAGVLYFCYSYTKKGLWAYDILSHIRQTEISLDQYSGEFEDVNIVNNEILMTMNNQKHIVRLRF